MNCCPKQPFLGDYTTPILYTPEDRKMDCYCRGGSWKSMPPGAQIEMGAEMQYCVPGSMPTGKTYDKNTKGCVAMPGVPQSQIRPGGYTDPLKPGKTNWWPWIIGGALLLTLFYLSKKNGKDKQGDQDGR